MTRPRYKQKKQRKQYTSGESRKKSKFKRGIYYPINISKYREPIDRTMSKVVGGAEYRSSWELVFMKFMDFSDNIEFWGTEAFAIQYISPKDNQTHRYYVDFIFVTTDGQKHLVEIKPKIQCNDPVNLAKWEAAERYCKQIGAIFTVVTEVHLKQWKLL